MKPNFAMPYSELFYLAEKYQIGHSIFESVIKNYNLFDVDQNGYIHSIFVNSKVLLNHEEGCLRST
jgi:hypothetical protein